MKTAELAGIALDWAVCKAAGLIDAYPKLAKADRFSALHSKGTDRSVHPSTDWAQGGPIIERMKISLDQREGEPCCAFLGVPVRYEHAMFAPKGQPLIAAMRCFVASKFGNEIDIPEELR